MILVRKNEFLNERPVIKHSDLTKFPTETENKW